MPAQDMAAPATGPPAVIDAAPQDHVDRRLLFDGRLAGADSPFGGFKRSGVGRETGVVGMEEFLERKTFAVPITGRSA